MEGQRRILGTPVPVTINGKEYLIPPWTLAQEGQFAAWVEARSRARLQARRKDLGEDEYREQMDGLRRDVDAGLYEWGSKIVVGAWSSMPGGKHLLYLTLAAVDKTVTPAAIDAVAADRVQWKQLWEEVLIPLNFPPSGPTPEAPKPEAGSPS